MLFIPRIVLTKELPSSIRGKLCYDSIVSRDATHEKWREVSRKMADQNYERVVGPSRGYRFSHTRGTTLLLFSSLHQFNETFYCDVRHQVDHTKTSDYVKTMEHS